MAALLALCSHALYNEELLFMKKQLVELQKKERLREIPKVNYSHCNEWRSARKKFDDKIKDYIFNTKFLQDDSIRRSFNIKSPWLLNLKKIYEYQLNILTKGEYRLWCQRKTQMLMESIQIGFRGLRKILSAGWGSFPFNHWRDTEYRYFVRGIVEEFENADACYFNDNKGLWLEEIVCFSDNVDVFIIKLQSLWRGFSIRNKFKYTIQRGHQQSVEQ